MVDLNNPVIKSVMEDIKNGRVPKHKSERNVYVPPKKYDHLNIGRNDICPCGSGLKFKKCCINKLKEDE